MQDYFEREEEAIIEAYERGDITQEQMRIELRDLRRSMQDELRDRAQQAYDDVMEGGW